MAEEAQHRDHPVDRAHQHRRGRDAAGGDRLTDRQCVDEGVEHRGRIARDVAAVGEDLPLELVVEQLQGRLHMAVLAGERHRRGGKRQRGGEARHAVRGVAEGLAQQPDLTDQRAQEAVVEAAVAAFEDQRRLGQPRQQAAGDRRCARRSPATGPRRGSNRRRARDRWSATARCRRRADGAASRSRAEPAPNPPTVPGLRRASGRRPRRSGGKHEHAGIDVGGDGRIAVRMSWGAIKRRSGVMPTCRQRPIAERRSEARSDASIRAATSRPRRARFAMLDVISPPPFQEIAPIADAARAPAAS